MTPGILSGKMLQWYSERLRIYSWFMKYCRPKLASVGVIAAFPVVTLVGANKHHYGLHAPFDQDVVEMEGRDVPTPGRPAYNFQL